MHKKINVISQTISLLTVAAFIFNIINVELAFALQPPLRLADRAGQITYQTMYGLKWAEEIIEILDESIAGMTDFADLGDIQRGLDRNIELERIKKAIVFDEEHLKALKIRFVEVKNEEIQIIIAEDIVIRYCVTRASPVVGQNGEVYELSGGVIKEGDVLTFKTGFAKQINNGLKRELWISRRLKERLRKNILKRTIDESERMPHKYRSRKVKKVDQAVLEQLEGRRLFGAGGLVASQVLDPSLEGTAFPAEVVEYSAEDASVAATEENVPFLGLVKPIATLRAVGNNTDLTGEVIWASGGVEQNIVASDVTYEYDNLGRLIREIIPGATITTWTYYGETTRIYQKTACDLVNGRVDTYTRFDNDTNRIQRKEMSQPDLNGNIAYEYEDTTLGLDGKIGRMKVSELQNPDEEGCIAYETDYEGITQVPSVKRGFADLARQNRVLTYTYERGLLMTKIYQNPETGKWYKLSNFTGELLDSKMHAQREEIYNDHEFAVLENVNIFIYTPLGNITVKEIYDNANLIKNENYVRYTYYYYEHFKKGVGRIREKEEHDGKRYVYTAYQRGTDSPEAVEEYDTAGNLIATYRWIYTDLYFHIENVGFVIIGDAAVIKHDLTDGKWYVYELPDKDTPWSFGIMRLQFATPRELFSGQNKDECNYTEAPDSLMPWSEPSNPLRELHEYENGKLMEKIAYKDNWIINSITTYGYRELNGTLETTVRKIYGENGHVYVTTTRYDESGNPQEAWGIGGSQAQQSQEESTSLSDFKVEISRDFSRKEQRIVTRSGDTLRVDYVKESKSRRLYTTWEYNIATGEVTFRPKNQKYYKQYFPDGLVRTVRIRDRNIIKEKNVGPKAYNKAKSTMRKAISRISGLSDKKGWRIYGHDKLRLGEALNILDGTPERIGHPVAIASTQPAGKEHYTEEDYELMYGMLEPGAEYSIAQVFLLLTIVKARRNEGSDKYQPLVSASEKYAEENKELLRQVIKKLDKPLLIRMPGNIAGKLEGYEIVNWSRILEQSNVYLEIYDQDFPDKKGNFVSSKEFPHERSKQNTMTLYAAPEEKDKAKRDIQDKMQSNSFNRSIVVPLCSIGDSAELIKMGLSRATDLGIKLIHIANFREKAEEDAFIIDIITRYKDLIQSYGIEPPDLTREEILTLVADSANINIIVNTLFKIVNSMPTEAIVDKMHEKFMHAREATGKAA